MMTAFFRDWLDGHRRLYPPLADRDKTRRREGEARIERTLADVNEDGQAVQEAASA